jgi:hypothetical protein
VRLIFSVEPLERLTFSVEPLGRLTLHSPENKEFIRILVIR